MQVEVQEISPCVKRLEIVIPPETVKGELDKAYRNLGRTIKLDGFRPGKVPRHILEGLYRNTVEKEVIQKLIPESCEEILKDKGIKAAGPPVLGGEVTITRDQPLKFSVTVEVIPQIDLKPYEDLKVTKKLINVTEEDVERALKNIQENSAEYEVRPEDLSERGDLIIVDWQADALGETLAIKERENFSMVIGSSVFGPTVEESLIGARVGEQRAASAVFPFDYKEKDWAGKTVNFTFTLKELKKKKLPAIDDEFTRGLGYEGLEDLKSRLRRHLEEMEELTSTRNLRDEIITKLIQENPIEVPPILVENHIQLMIMDLKQRLKIQGLEKAQLDIDKLRANYGKRAEERVKGEIILAKIAEAENLTVMEEEINKELASVATSTNRSIKSIKDDMAKKGSLETFKMRLLLEKALDAIIAKCQIETIRESREGLPSEETNAKSGLEES